MTTTSSGTDMLIAKLALNDTDPTREVPFEDDWLTYNNVDQKSLEFELDLFSTKWFDYRHLTGVQATKLYVEAYGVVYKEIYARELDYERAQHVKPPEFDRLVAGLRQADSKCLKIWKGMWRGRQLADALGMPYRTYIDLAFTFRMRRWKQRYLPQPWHLFHEYDVEKIQARWLELQDARIYTAEHPAYMCQNYCGAAHQNDYHEWIFQQATRRGNTAEVLARFVENNQLTLEKVELRMPADIYEQVAALVA